MGTQAARSAIRAHLEANWDTDAAALVFPNEGDPPADVSQPWIFVEVRGSAYYQASIGAGSITDNLWRDEGSIWATINVPIGTGEDDAGTLAQQFMDLFRGTELAGNLEFREFQDGDGERSDNGLWWQYTAMIIWQMG
ncbi:phage tail terminator-like protein [Novispirillum sp. DQ9]|uniref:phage tail terminator-like protein n=1 Tax=Novispirillum sp. DQ9 TaxID=3398612 RepID=UPI003C7B6777